MKKAFCTALAAVFVAACFAGCSASPLSSIGANVRLTSSDAADAAAWLSERLGERLTDRVVLGTDADGYDADLSALEADGYIIRACGGEVALFARTTNGLDRAVRRYAKAVESGAAIGDVTYHEGYRIKRVELAGRDVAEYTIYTEDEPQMLASAKLLASRIAVACGALLPVSTEAPAAPYIALRYVGDEALSTCGYRWSVSEDGLTIDCSDGYKQSSSYCAVTRFLEKEFGWFGLYFGIDSLAPSDLVSIEAGESGGEVNAFQWIIPGTDDEPADRFDHTYTNLSGINHACHGLSNNKFGGELSLSPDHDWAIDQPCYLDDTFLESTIEDVKTHIENKLDGGAKIGEDFFCIDLAAPDNNYWCDCKKCTAMLRSEGTVAASVITWANALSEAVSEDYPGLVYQTFAYFGTNKAPKTVAPNEHVYVTFCYDTSCDMHAHDGRDCTTLKVPGLGAGHDNVSRAEQLEAWLGLTDNVYIWYYSMGQGFLTLNYVDMALDDMRYFSEIGVKGFYMESHDGRTKDTCFGTLRIARWAMMELCWNIDMTDDEYSAYVDRVIAALYGEDSAAFVRAYVDSTAAIQRNGLCAHCWSNAAHSFTLVPKPTAAAFDTLFKLMENAIASADSEKQEMRSTLLSAACIYQGCVSSYFDAYGAGDDVRVKELSERYALIVPRLEKCGKDVQICWLGGWDGTEAAFEPDMEVMAWTVWKKFASDLSLTLPERAIPARVADILAERG